MQKQSYDNLNSLLLKNCHSCFLVTVLKVIETICALQTGTNRNALEKGHRNHKQETFTR